MYALYCDRRMHKLGYIFNIKILRIHQMTRSSCHLFLIVVDVQRVNWTQPVFCYEIGPLSPEIITNSKTAWICDPAPKARELTTPTEQIQTIEATWQNKRQ